MILPFFSVVHNRDSSAAEINNDLAKLSHWAHQRKMRFNPDPTKQAVEVIFSRKVNKDSHPTLTFNNSIVYQAMSQKHLGTLLDNRLSFQEHLRLVFSKINRTIGLLHKLQCLIPGSALLTIYKTFIRRHLDYGDIIYKNAYNSFFHQKIESVQYNACLAITGAIRGASKEKLYDELGLESLQLRHWLRKLCYFYRFYKHKSPHYLCKLVPLRQSPYTTRNTENISLFKPKNNFFKNYFFPSAVIEWNNLDLNIRNVGSFNAFKNNILSFIRPTPNNVFKCENHRGIKLITRLCVGLSHMPEHRFKHSFKIHQILLPVAFFMLNRLLIIFSTLPCTMMKDIPSWKL